MRTERYQLGILMAFTIILMISSSGAERVVEKRLDYQSNSGTFNVRLNSRATVKLSGKTGEHILSTDLNLNGIVNVELTSKGFYRVKWLRGELVKSSKLDDSDLDLQRTSLENIKFTFKIQSFKDRLNTEEKLLIVSYPLEASCELIESTIHTFTVLHFLTELSSEQLPYEFSWLEPETTMKVSSLESYKLPATRVKLLKVESSDNFARYQLDSENTLGSDLKVKLTGILTYFKEENVLNLKAKLRSTYNLGTSELYILKPASSEVELTIELSPR